MGKWAHCKTGEWLGWGGGGWGGADPCLGMHAMPGPVAFVECARQLMLRLVSLAVTWW